MCLSLDLTMDHLSPCRPWNIKAMETFNSKMAASWEQHSASGGMEWAPIHQQSIPFNVVIALGRGGGFQATTKET